MLIWIIRVYWFLIPAEKRNKCLFKKSCSNYVYDVTKKHGLLKGIRAFLYRYKHCRPGYYIINDKEGRLLFISVQNEVFKDTEINNRILKNN